MYARPQFAWHRSPGTVRAWAASCRVFALCVALLQGCAMRVLPDRVFNLALGSRQLRYGREGKVADKMRWAVDRFVASQLGVI